MNRCLPPSLPPISRLRFFFNFHVGKFKNSWHRLDSGWHASADCRPWEFRSEVGRTAFAPRQWPARSSTCLQNSGKFHGHRYTRWTVWRGSLPGMSLDWRAIGRHLPLRLPCARGQMMMEILEYEPGIFMAFKISELPWRSCNRSTDCPSLAGTLEYSPTGCGQRWHLLELRRQHTYNRTNKCLVYRDLILVDKTA